MINFVHNSSKISEKQEHDIVYSEDTIGWQCRVSVQIGF